MTLTGGELVTLILGVVAQGVTLIVALRTSRKVDTTTNNLQAQIVETSAQIADVKTTSEATHTLARDFINTDAGYLAGRSAGYRQAKTDFGVLADDG